MTGEPLAILGAVDAHRTDPLGREQAAILVETQGPQGHAKLARQIADQIFPAIRRFRGDILPCFRNQIHIIHV